MARMKTFLIYALIIIVFYFYSNFLIEIGMKGTYHTIVHGTINVSNPVVEVKEAKATYINGYVEGTMTNNTENRIDNKYIKIDFYSENNVQLGTKYVEIQNLEGGQTRDFRIAFKLTDVESFEISIVEEAENATEEQFLSEEMTTTAIIATLFLLCLI